MAESSNSAAASGQTQTAAKPTKAPNPVWKMMGMPNFRLKLPSRNWMIFLTVTGSFTAALVYDRKQKKRAQQKWCDLVAHLSKEPLPIDQTRRKLTVFLSAPPGDGLRVAREHFKEYVKPILVAAALDYQVIEGRREGDIRAGLAERIRKSRRKSGESSSVVEETGIEEVVADAREKMGVVEEPVPKGDLIIGRNTWKEYIRDVPSPSEGAETSGSPDDTPTAENAEKKEEPEKKDEKPSKPTGPTPAYITPADYSSQNLPRSLPQSLDGSAPIHFPHILGFLNTPIRIYRYLNQRHLADSVGREVAGIVLASTTRPYSDGSFSTDSELTPAGVDAAPASDNLLGGNYEQQTLLEEEEQDWHKSVHKKDEANPNKEREWVDSVVLDSRIAARMQRYVLSPEDEARSQRIAEGAEYILGEERPTPVPFWQRMWIKYGYGEDEETLKRKPILGNIDGEDDQ
ncbi:import inner membrane translocase subunit tim54 [Aspergillus bombycis]|uniref:Mitochondrial import inner membrane translocase subunit TIM54 n=1 Tax=Aspergillus bombycis TaxID=109264 RepID=A0A1F8AC76_9EURO|nr:import inner membrane translocase subunit tim54 [Aspergillus bombycis]OGM49035.1 import inner membrane translocase subunit tim54 [Aspergillus bombycis]